MTFRAPPPDLPPPSEAAPSGRDTSHFDRRAVQISLVGVGALLVQSHFLGPKLVRMYGGAELLLDPIADVVLAPEATFGAAGIILLCAILGIYLRRDDASTLAGLLLGFAATVAIAANAVVAWVLYAPVSQVLRHL